MTASKEYFEQIITLAQAAIADLTSPPTEELPPDEVDPVETIPWSVPEQTLANESGYLAFPMLTDCTNGDILCLYRKGTGHTNLGATLVYKRSLDKGMSWGVETEMFSVANKDCRIGSLSTTPTGRLVAFSRTLVNATTVDKFYRHYSDDNGVTWIVDEMFPTANGAPFGRVVVTSNGLARVCYLNNKIIMEFSTDNGLSWGSPVYIWNTPQSTIEFAEPSIIAIDNNRLVMVCRNNLNGAHYYFQKSSDGGLTWTSPSRATWSGSTINQAAPMSLCLKDGKVWCAWDGRSPVWVGAYSITDAETFFAEPYRGWARGLTPPSQKAGHTSVIGSSGSSPGSSYGYSNLLTVPEGVLCAWYDSKTGNGDTQCKIMIEGLKE